MKCLTIVQIVVMPVVLTACMRSSVPVSVGSHLEVDACGGVSQVQGLGPGEFLAVPRGPGTRFEVVDKLVNGQYVSYCDGTNDGKWLGIVYSDDDEDVCGIGSSIATEKAYTGPCKFGWADARYLLLIADQRGAAIGPMNRWRTGLISVLGFLLCAACARNSATIKVGGNPYLDPCAGAQVRGLPSNNSYLPVHKSPDDNSQIVGWVGRGQLFAVCDGTKDGRWRGIVYGAMTDNEQEDDGCGLSSPISEERPYIGPCKSGWVRSIWVEIVAG